MPSTPQTKTIFWSGVFEVNGDEYTVIRGMSPRKFEIYKNDDLVDMNANAKDQQKLLEVIMGMDFKIFTQLVVLNKARYVPFMELSAADRRTVVENVLGIEVFTEANKVCREIVSDIDDKLFDLKSQRERLGSDIKRTEDFIKDIQQSIERQKTNNDAQINELVEKLNGYGSEIDDAESVESDYINRLVDMDSVEQSKRKFEKLSVQFQEKKKSEQEKLNFFIDNDDCPTCGQLIDESLKKQKSDETQKKMDSINSTVTDLLGEFEKILQQSRDLKEIKKELDDHRSKKRGLESEAKSIKSQIDTLERMSKQTDRSEELAKYHSQWNEKTEKKEQIEQQIKGEDKQHETYSILRDALKDDGIKAMVVSDYMPLFNRKVNDFLQAMSLYVNIVIDENFNEKFESPHHDKFTYENLSTGQQARLNLAMWLALLELGSTKNSVVTNLLALDESLENMDSEGVREFMKLVREKLPEKNILIITQRFDEFRDFFDAELKFKLVNGFTEQEE